MNYLDENQIRQLTDSFLSAAKQAGADDAAVNVLAYRNESARFSRNQIIQNVEQRQNNVTLAVAVGKHQASVSTDIISRESIQQNAKKAVEIAKMFPENPEYMPPSKPSEFPRINAFDERTDQVSQQEKAGIIREICRNVAKEDLLAFGTLVTGHTIHAAANTNGLFAMFPKTKAELTLTVRTQDGKGSSREIQDHYLFDALDIDKTIQNTIQKAVRSKTAKEIPPGDYRVILSPTAAMNYFMLLFWTLDARRIEEKRSALNSHFKIDQITDSQLFSSNITIHSRVNHPDHPESPFSIALSMDGYAGQGQAATVFSDGLPVGNYPIIENGCVRKLFYTAYWAYHKGIDITGFPTLIEFQGSNRSIEELIADQERALFVNSFWYIRFVDPNHLLLTGLTRDGVFLVEDGAITTPVKNLRFNESPLVSLQNVISLGRPERRSAWFNTVLIPPFVIDNFSFSVDTDAV
ncbi:TldD/PmbA family protein [bacterium]|nr:TldD/PmbA family protein [candidate division CSSED10-310 bacterium]